MIIHAASSDECRNKNIITDNNIKILNYIFDFSSRNIKMIMIFRDIHIYWKSSAEEANVNFRNFEELSIVDPNHHHNYNP